MSRDALLIPVDPTVPVSVLDLGADDRTGHAAIKAALDGAWLEAIPHALPFPLYAFADEEGLLKHLAPNHRATMLLGRGVVGPVVLVGNDGTPEVAGIDAEVRDALVDLGIWPA